MAVGNPDEPVTAFTTPLFLKIYKAECRRKRAFIREGDLMRRSIGKVAKTLRPPMADEQFRDLLVAENLATLPRTLAARILRDTYDLTASGTDNRPSLAAIGGGDLFGGITPGVVELFQDCCLPAKIFGVLRKLAPARQLEVAKLMIAMNRVTYNYAKMAVALSSQSQLADSSHPGWKFARLSDEQLAMLKREFADLSNRVRNTMDHYGALALENISAGRYINQLLENVRVVRYLAQNFPESLCEFQKMTEFNQQFG
ncbi:plasmid partitioning protein RepB C-terminal domain-containing protein [Mesorhizobium sp. dw_380]|uniref:plasmid partitioning protein RepB C-terminal domain-containing protein n=1 Tax=Mesorhizobium sp. dw_380 TaxID=2812001 RepID=UPI001BDF329C|nr:plasmid partitioning protein RepB C-terminal domain-containing protein [Mesorhizobium sp. dw_380]